MIKCKINGTKELIEVERFPIGLYIIKWKSGGSSSALVNVDQNGTRYFTCTNWVAPMESKLADFAGVIKSMKMILV